VRSSGKICGWRYEHVPSEQSTRPCDASTSTIEKPPLIGAASTKVSASHASLYTPAVLTTFDAPAYSVTKPWPSAPGASIARRTTSP
jgi:hypothetical protein